MTRVSTYVVKRVWNQVAMGEPHMRGLPLRSTASQPEPDKESGDHTSRLEPHSSGMLPYLEVLRV